MRMRLASAFVAASVGFTLSAARAAAQASDADQQPAVLAVVQRLFDGMRAGDSAMVRSTFLATTAMIGTGMRDGHYVATVGTTDRFVNAIGTPHDKQWDERIRNPIVQIDGSLATVWAEYTFALGGVVNHCGVDSFQLVRTDDGWKIAALADTRRTTCR